MAHASEWLRRYLDGELGECRSEDVEIRDWALDDPDGQDPERVREIHDEIERRVSDLFDEIESSEP